MKLQVRRHHASDNLVCAVDTKIISLNVPCSQRSTCWNWNTELYQVPPCQKCKHTPISTVVMELCNSSDGRGRLQDIDLCGAAVHMAEQWLTAEFAAMADEGQAPSLAGPPSSSFWRHRFCSGPGWLTGSYSPVKPLITCGGRLVGQAGHVMHQTPRATQAHWKCSVARNAASRQPSVCSCTGETLKY